MKTNVEILENEKNIGLLFKKIEISKKFTFLGLVYEFSNT